MGTGALSASTYTHIQISSRDSPWDFQESIYATPTLVSLRYYMSGVHARTAASTQGSKLIINVTGMQRRYTPKSPAMSSGEEGKCPPNSQWMTYGIFLNPFLITGTSLFADQTPSDSQHLGSYEDPVGPLGCINLHARAKVYWNKGLHQFENWLHRQGVFIAYGALRIRLPEYR